MLAFLSAPLVHEAGHFVCALVFGCRLRFVWEMPSLSSWKQRLIAKAGFGSQVLAGAVLVRLAPELAFPFLLGTLAEWMLYPRSAYSDFRWM